MAATPFRAIHWAPNDLISEDKMDQTAANMNWLRDNTPRAHYRAHGVNKKDQIKIASGLALITARKQMRASKRVSFGNFFSARSRPIVTTGIISAKQRRIFVTVDGIGQLHPDHTGFDVHVVMDEAAAKKNRRILRNFYVSWQAMGY